MPKTPDAVALLKADHKKVKELFDAFEKAKKPAEKAKIAEQAMKELRIHATIEEEIFYPAAREALGKEEDDLLNEAEEEHRVAKTIIEELSKTGVKDERAEAKFIVLAENVRHHIKEEESEMFKEAKDADDLDLEALGAEMLERKTLLMNDEGELEGAEKASEVKPYQELAEVR